jgi:RNA recognition motif. (a.k.a. RRM, RBD, or RNP domain)
MFASVAGIISCAACVNFVRSSFVCRAVFVVTEHHDVPSPVLHVRVAQVAYPVSIDTLHAVRSQGCLSILPKSVQLCVAHQSVSRQAFKPYGSVLRIIIFTKADMYMALIELDSIASATTAKGALDGQFLFRSVFALPFSSCDDRFPIAVPRVQWL